jgi:hypothetical protein
VTKPRIYADFHNANASGRVRLNSVGTAEDLARQGITLREGMPLTLYLDDLDAKGQPDELRVDGVVSYSDTTVRFRPLDVVARRQVDPSISVRNASLRNLYWPKDFRARAFLV